MGATSKNFGNRPISYDTIRQSQANRQVDNSMLIADSGSFNELIISWRCHHLALKTYASNLENSTKSGITVYCISH